MSDLQKFILDLLTYCKNVQITQKELMKMLNISAPTIRMRLGKNYSKKKDEIAQPQLRISDLIQIAKITNSNLKITIENENQSLDLIANFVVKTFDEPELAELYDESQSS